MHDAEGPGSQEPGPSASPAQLESLRRQLYARGPSPDAVQTYLGARADVMDGEADRGDAPEADADAPDGSTAAAPREDPSGPARSRRRRARPVVIGAVLAAIVLVTALWWTAGSGAALPERIGPPAAPGRTLLYYSRPENPESAPDKVTFEPADERMLFRADGRRLVVVLRCIGRGTVRITAAEQRFDFRCDDRLQTLSRRSSAPVQGSFLILGRTVGDVVWGMRVTSVADALPS